MNNFFNLEKANNFWIFQCHPQNIDLSTKYNDFSVLERKNEITPNDYFWLRFTGVENGFYGIGRTLTSAEDKPNKYGRWTCVYELIYLHQPPLLIKELKDDEILGNEANITGRQYTNQKIDLNIHMKILDYSKDRLINFSN